MIFKKNLDLKLISAEAVTPAKILLGIAVSRKLLRKSWSGDIVSESAVISIKRKKAKKYP